jgi:hypothetical protein
MNRAIVLKFPLVVTLWSTIHSSASCPLEIQNTQNQSLNRLANHIQDHKQEAELLIPSDIVAKIKPNQIPIAQNIYRTIAQTYPQFPLAFVAGTIDYEIAIQKVRLQKSNNFCLSNRMVFAIKLFCACIPLIHTYETVRDQIHAKKNSLASWNTDKKLFDMAFPAAMKHAIISTMGEVSSACFAENRYLHDTALCDDDYKELLDAYQVLKNAPHTCPEQRLLYNNQLLAPPTQDHVQDVLIKLTALFPHTPIISCKCTIL